MTPFIPASSLVTAPDARPSRWALVLHGILGTGANFRTLARRLAAALPAWGFVLVDLRMHGQSQGAPPPHTVGAASDDLRALAATLPGPVRAVIGHSFGGKVALTYAAARSRWGETPQAPGRGRSDLDRVLVLDSPLGTRRRTSMAEEVLALLRPRAEETFATRAAFVDGIVASGQRRAIGEWLAMNLRAVEGGFRFGLDLAAIDALLESYAQTDAWPLVASPPGRSEVHVLVAERSDAFDVSERARLSAIAAAQPRTHEHLIAGAGHWLHADAPDAVAEVLRAALHTVGD